MNRYTCIVTLLVGLSAAPAVVAQEAPHRPARLSGAIVLDGLLDEEGWVGVESLPMTMNFPVFGGDITQPTDLRLTYDDEYLYVGGILSDDHPAGPQGRSLARDSAADSDDLVAIIIDSFDDNENALVFMTTPAGVRIDQTVFGDAQMLNDAMPLNESWNTYWDVAAQITESGWQVEFRIPWSSLRFQDEGGRVEMGMLAFRWNPGNIESQTFPAVDPKWGFMGPFKPSIARQVVFENVFARRPLYVSPYVLGGLRTEAVPTGDGSAWTTDNDPDNELGLDIKYSLNSNLTLDLTVNTDFAQVEADDQQVNLTRFSLFFPEKRQFFQERSSVFEFNTGGQTRLFYSRTIGLSDEGPVRLLGGGRLVGRAGGWDIGMLNMQTGRADFEADDGPLHVPSENFGVLRARRRVFNENSFVGGILTSRLGADGTSNVAFGADGTIRVGGNDYALFGWAQTFDDAVPTTLFDPATSLARIRVERRLNTGLAWEFDVTRAGPDYDPGMGFIFRTDFTRLGDRVFFTWQPEETSPFYSLAVGLSTETYLRNSDGSLESSRFGPEITFAHRSGLFGILIPSVYIEDLTEPFELTDDIEVPEGRYRYAGITVFAQPPPRLLRFGVTAQAGSFFDGWRVSLGLTPTWNVSRHLEIGGEYQINRVGFPDRSQRWNADLIRFRVRAAVDTKLSFSSFVQYSMADDEIGANIRLRYNPREGNDLFLVYNQAVNTSLDRTIPRLPRSDSRTILVKYTHTFGF